MQHIDVIINHHEFVNKHVNLDDVLVDLQKVCQYKFDLHHCTFQVTRDPRLA